MITDTEVTQALPTYMSKVLYDPQFFQIKYGLDLSVWDDRFRSQEAQIFWYFINFSSGTDKRCHTTSDDFTHTSFKQTIIISIGEFLYVVLSFYH